MNSEQKMEVMKDGYGNVTIMIKEMNKQGTLSTIYDMNK